MKLKKLKIENFRGIKSIELDFNGKVNEVCGLNGVGKTTVIDAIMWLLCDETFVYGKQNEDNKNKNNHLATINIVGTFEKSDGREITLERNYFEKWKDDEFDRIENQFKINDVKYKANEYFDRIRNEIGIRYNTKVKGFNLLRCVIDTNYLDSIDYKIARKFVEEMLDLTSDAELLKDAKFNNISSKLYDNNYDFDKTKSYYKDKLKDVGNEIDKLENEVNLLEDMLVTNDSEELEKAKVEYNQLLEKNANDKQELKNKINGELLEVQQEIENSKKDYRKAVKEKEDAINDCILNGNKYKATIDSKNAEITALKSQIDAVKYEETLLKNSLSANTKALEDAKTKTFAEVKCPECGYVLNKDAQSQFELEKANAIKELEQKIEIDNSKLERNQKKCKELETKIKAFEKELKPTKEEFDKLGELYKTLYAEKQGLETHPEIDAKVTQLENQCSALRIKGEADLRELEQKQTTSLNEIGNKIYQLQESVNKHNVISQKKETIKTIKKEKAVYELCLDNLEKFKQLKLKMTRENTKKVFPNIEFEMLEISPTTGSIQECCHATYNNVEFSGVNNGNRYLIGVEVIEDIKRALNVTEDLPIIFDRKADMDSNNYSKLLKLTNAQIINTLVTNDKEITIKGE